MRPPLSYYMRVKVNDLYYYIVLYGSHNIPSYHIIQYFIVSYEQYRIEYEDTIFIILLNMIYDKNIRYCII